MVAEFDSKKEILENVPSSSMLFITYKMGCNETKSPRSQHVVKHIKQFE